MENESKVRKPTGTRYSDEVRKRAVRMVLEHQHEYQTQGGGDPLDRLEDGDVARDASQLDHSG